MDGKRDNRRENKKDNKKDRKGYGKRDLKRGRRKNSFISLKNRIFLGNAVIAVLVLALLWMVCMALFYHAMTNRAREDYGKMLGNLARYVDTIAVTVEDYARVISQSRGLQDEIKEYLEREEEDKKYYKAKLWVGLAEAGSDIINPTTIVAGMAVFVNQEVMYSGYDIPVESVYEIIRPEDINRACERQKPVWNPLSLISYGNPHKDKEYVFPVSKLIRDKNTGHELGVVTLFVSESYFSEVYDGKGSGAGSYYIVDENGQIISSADKKELCGDFSQIVGITQEQYLACKEDGAALIMRGKVPRLLLSMNITSTEGRQGWRIFCVAPLEDLAREQSRMRVLLLIILACAMALLLLVSWLIARTVTKPVYQLLDTMNAIADHQTFVRAPDKIGGEMGLLAEEFNSLMGSLEESRNAFYREQKMKRKNEYKLLQAQINPHFLYNTMETIASFIKLGMSREALEALHSLVDFYRLSLSSGREIITVEEELRLTECYLKLQSLRYVEYMDYRIEFEQDTYALRIPKLTIQPLVENAIYHGIKESRKRGIIFVEGRISGQELVILVYDTGKGIDARQLEVIQDNILKRTASNGTSFGLGNVAQRLNLLYGERFHMRVESILGEFTEVYIRIPVDGNIEENFGGWDV